MQIKFGFNQLLNATPAIITNIKRGLNFFSAGVLTFLPQIALWLHTTTDNLAVGIGIFMLAFNSIGLMFGVPITSATVPASQVTAVKTDDKP